VNDPHSADRCQPFKKTMRGEAGNLKGGAFGGAMGRCRWLKWVLVVTLAGWVVSGQLIQLDVLFGGRLLGVSSAERVASAVQSGASAETNVVTLPWRITMQHGCWILGAMVLAYVMHALLSASEVWTLLSRMRPWLRGAAVVGVTGFLLVPALYYGQDFSTSVGLMAPMV
jgi:hypothetical protein